MTTNPSSAGTPAVSLKTIRPGLRFGGSSLCFGDAALHYAAWRAPTVIISDGPYGLGKYPGEPLTPSALPSWYAPHAAEWAKRARPDTTLWFWNSEVGWALVHPILEAHGWEYQECCVWDKGLAHVAGNCNSKTIRGMPVVTEVAVRYTRRNTLQDAHGNALTLKQWLRSEWMRSGLPMSQANLACGVKNAATRKYLTQCHLWYFPPAEAMLSMSAYCATHGKGTQRPYFSLDGKSALTARMWDAMRSKWTHTHGTTNVWRSPPVHGGERFKLGNAYIHANQKPLALLNLQITASSDTGDIIWEPFGGLCSASAAAIRSGRAFHAAEILPDYFDTAARRLHSEFHESLLNHAKEAA